MADRKKKIGGAGLGGGWFRLYLQKLESRKKKEMLFTPMIEVGSAPPNLLIF